MERAGAMDTIRRLIMERTNDDIIGHRGMRINRIRGYEN